MWKFDRNFLIFLTLLLSALFTIYAGWLSASFEPGYILLLSKIGLLKTIVNMHCGSAFDFFVVLRKMNIFGGMKMLGGHHKTGLVLGIISTGSFLSMHFRIFSSTSTPTSIHAAVTLDYYNSAGGLLHKKKRE